MLFGGYIASSPVDMGEEIVCLRESPAPLIANPPSLARQVGVLVCQRHEDNLNWSRKNQRT